VHLQGCTLGCGGCFNPDTHDAAAGEVIAVTALADKLTGKGLRAVTISGGEPFQQMDALSSLCVELRARHVHSIVVFSGYSLAEIQALPGNDNVLGNIDALIAGRYEAKEAIENAILSSSNQRLHLLTEQHTLDEFECGGEVEITISPEGQVTMTGFPSHGLAHSIKKMGADS